MTYDNEYGTCTLPAGVCFSALRAAQFFTSYFSRKVRNVRGWMTVNGQRATGARTRQTAGHHRSTCARRGAPRG